MRLFVIDLPDVLTKKGDTSCQKNKKQQSKDIKGEELDVNGNPIDPNREYIGNKVKVPMLSPNSSIYKKSAVIIPRKIKKFTGKEESKVA